MNRRGPTGRDIKAGRNPEDLSADEIRQLLRYKRSVARRERLERYRRTGRIIVLTSEAAGTPLEGLRSGVDAQTGDTQRLSRRKSAYSLGNRFLLLIELGVIATVVVLAFSNFGLLRKLNRETAQGLELPGLTPTPLIQAVVLPSGHTPPTSPGGARPNEAEIPAHLRPLAQSFKSFPIPTPGVEQAIRIQIPAIGIDAPVVQGDGWEQLKKGVAQHIGTANPGQRGNMVLSAHNDIFGEFFRDLDQLKAGDEFTVFTQRRPYTYVVTGWVVVEPTRVEFMAPTPDETATLISCYPYLVDTERIVVQARLADS